MAPSNAVRTSSAVPTAEAALIVVDVQRGFDDATHWGPRNNPGCEDNIAALVHHWRVLEWPVVFVRHDSTEPGSPLQPGLPGNAFKSALTGEPDLLVRKSTHSSFGGSPSLEGWLRDNRLATIVVCGITTNHCCETTGRHGSDLGFDVVFVLDATHTFDRLSQDGIRLRAQHLAAVTATNLAGEFATVMSTAQAIECLSGRPRFGGRAADRLS